METRGADGGDTVVKANSGVGAKFGADALAVRAGKIDKFLRARTTSKTSASDASGVPGGANVASGAGRRGPEGCLPADLQAQR